MTLYPHLENPQPGQVIHPSLILRTLEQFGHSGAKPRSATATLVATARSIVCSPARTDFTSSNFSTSGSANCACSAGWVGTSCISEIFSLAPFVCTSRILEIASGIDNTWPYSLNDGIGPLMPRNC